MRFSDRRRKQSSLDGTVPGIVYNRHRGGHRPASFPIDNLARDHAPQDYMSSHPDEYDPHPGEAIFFELDYSPYHPEPLQAAPDDIHGPVPAFQPEPDQVEYDDLFMTDEMLDQALGEVPYPPDALEPTPFDNDVMAEELSIGEPMSPELVPDRFPEDQFAPDSLDQLADEMLDPLNSPELQPELLQPDPTMQEHARPRPHPGA